MSKLVYAILLSKMLLEVFFVAEMKSPKWVATTRQFIKANHGFGWSISGWERNNKLITKVVYRYEDGSRNSILVDLELKIIVIDLFLKS